MFQFLRRWLPLAIIAASALEICAQGERMRVNGLPRGLADLLLAQLRPENEEEKRRWLGNLRWETHDLNGDSVPEIFLYIDHADWCGAGGSNCHYWVYRRTEKGYRLLLDDTRVRPLRSVSNGYRDLVSDHRIGTSPEHPGKWEYGRVHYKYDGRKYETHSSTRVLK